MSRLEQDTARGIDLINAVLARSLTELDAPKQEPVATPLAKCAAWHEREAARYHAMSYAADAEGDEALACGMAEQEQMHALYAAACREADKN